MEEIDHLTRRKIINQIRYVAFISKHPNLGSVVPKHYLYPTEIFNFIKMHVTVVDAQFS